MPVDYIIITNENLKNTFEQLATWKTQKGITSQVKTVEWIGQNYSGCDLQEKIRNFIKDAYSYWGASYVLLAGEHTINPVRYAYRSDGMCFEAPPDPFFIPADLYYSSLENNWNANGNNRFGEPGTGNYYPTDPDLKKVEFVDANCGKIVRHPNIIWHTEDAGWQWNEMQNVPPIDKVADVGFINSVCGWAAGRISGAVIIAQTANNGSNWQEQFKRTDYSTLSNYLIYQLDAINDQTAWAAGELTSPLDISTKIPYGSKLWHTADGQNWEEINGPGFIAYSLDFIDDVTGYVAGAGGQIAKTTDGGATWQTYQTTTINTFRKITFFDNQNGWACGDYGAIYHTTDGGSNWSPQTIGTTQDLCDINFADANTGWAISDISILYTTNGGANWNLAVNTGEYDLLSISAISPADVWISGKNGLLLHSSNGVNWDIKHSGSMQWVFTGDNVDLLPDVAVGRAPVANISEAQTFVNKIMDYEQNKYPENNDYLTRFLFMDAIEPWYCEQMQNPAYPNDYIGLPGYFSKYELYGPRVDPDPLHIPPYWEGNAALTKANAASAMNQGYHFIYHCDHSSVYTIGAGVNTVGEQFNRVDARNLTNENKCSILFSNGCDPNAFDSDCFSRSFMINPNGAGLTFIGNSVYGLSSQNWQARNYFYYLFHGITKNGLAFNTVKFVDGHRDPYFSAYNMNLMGDPEMPVWTNNPQTLVVEHLPSVTIGQNSFVVTVLDNNSIAVEGALVCLQKGYEAYAIGYTNSIGQVTFDYTPETAGEFSITVTAQNYLPYQGACTVLPSASGYICYDNSQFDDDDLNSTQGNGDGILNPGETVDMLLTIKNTGSEDVLQANVSINTNDQYITPKSFSTAAHKIFQGQSRICDAPYTFIISPNCPDQHNIVFYMNANSFSDSFVVKVLADSLAQTGHKVESLSGNQYIITDLQITNFGTGAADGATATLTTEDPAIVIGDGESAVGPVISDGIVTVTDGFSFTAPDLASAKFTLTLKDRFNRQWAQSNFELVPPATPTVLTATSIVEGVALKWGAVSGALGYNVYRSATAGGPYDANAKINHHAMKQTSYYLDKDVFSQTQYYYVVTALDASANESVNSNEASIYSPLSYKPGWPVIAGTRGDYNWSSAITGDIDGDGDKEVILGANDGHIFIWHHPGATAPNNWSKSFGTAYVSVALGDVDKCGLPEIIAGIGNGTTSEFKICVYKADGTLLSFEQVYTGANTNTESVISISDIDRNGWLDILVLCKAACTIYDYEWNGTDINQKWSCVVPASPTGMAVGDINTDDYFEIVTGTWTATGDIYAIDHDGVILWNKSLGSGVCSAPSIGDVNKDGKNEIVIVSSSGSGNCFVRDGNGNPLFSFAAGGQVWGSLALGDIDITVNGLEIVTGRTYNANGLIAWHYYDGTPVLGWPKNTGNINSSPIIGDVNGDGKMEIFDGSYDKKVFGYKFNGQALDGFPIPTTDNTYSSPFIADLDGNGSAELGIDMNDGKIHAWEIPGNADPTPDWPMSRHDAMNSGTFGWLNEFSGNITRNLTLSGDNFFNGDVVIDPGVTVIIRPNARMYFTPSGVNNLGTDPRCELIVKGSLIAQGDFGDSVRFLPWAPSPAPGNWYGIRVEAGGNAQLEHCVIENAAIGLQAVRSSPQISNSRIQGCHTGIYCDNSSAQIKNNLIVDNGPYAKSGKGTYKAPSDSLASKGLDSTSCIGTGIVAVNSNIRLDGNTIRNNSTGYYGGGTIQGTITNNTFEDNEYQGMDLYGDCFNMTITGNNFYRNATSMNGTSIWEWAGISVGYREISAASNLSVSGNTFTDNHAGTRCTRYGEIISTSNFKLIVLDNRFTTNNEVGLSVATDVNPNITVVAASNYFTGNQIYGVYVNAVDYCPLNLGDLNNPSSLYRGSNRLYNNGSYDVYYSVPAPITMKAEGNFWNKKLPSQIDARIYDDNENPAYGAVDFQPFYIWEWDEADAIWSGVVSIAGDVVVPADGTLKIEPGTVVRFISNFDAAASGNDPAKAELIIYGQLELKGKPGEPPVTFQSDAYKPQAGDWGGIAFMQPGTASKSMESKGVIVRELKNCIIRHAECGMAVDENQKLEMKQCKFEQNKTGASIDGQFELKSSGFSGNTLNGLILSGVAVGELKSCNFVNNETGLRFSGQASAECKDDTIASNNRGIVCQDYSAPLFKNTFISQNKNNGVTINGNARPSFGDDKECGHNIIASNLLYNLYNATSNNIMAKKNYWGTMNVDSVAKYIWDGKDQSGLGIVSYLPLWDGPKDTHHGGTQLETSAIALPTTFSLLQNAPNPMAGFTAINFAVAKPGNVCLKIYNISGQLVKTLVNENKQQGYYNVRWDGKDEAGRQVTAGIYFYRLASGEFNSTKKMVVLQ